MKASINLIPGGGVTSPRGFLAGAVSAGIKIEKGTRLDLGILRSEVPATAAAVFSRNKLKAAPVVLCQQRLEKGRATAVVINSGYANSCTGKQGTADAWEMSEVAARYLGLAPDEVLVQTEPAEGLAVAADKLATVAVDTQLTPELRLEGLAREVVRRVQAMRKTAGFDISDRITTYYQAEGDLAEVFQTWGEYLKAETLSTELVANKPAADAYVEAHKLGGQELTLGVKRNP